MTISKLVEALEKAGFETEPASLLDALWLATQFSGGGAGERKRRTSKSDVRAGRQFLSSATPSNSLPTQRISPVDTGQARVPGKAEAEQPIYPNTGTPSDSVQKASPVRVASAPSSLDRLAFARALRPFRRPWTRGGEMILDEEATAEAIAKAELSGQALVAPILRPVPERWFSVHLVIENDRAMDVWSDEIHALVSALRTTGAFAKLRIWRLEHSDAHGALLRAKSGGTIPASSIGGERQLIFYSTHGVSPAWLSGRVDGILRKWARHGSVALLQMLPQEWWGRTPLGEADARAAIDEAGVATSQGRITTAWWVDTLEHAAVAIPVLPLEPQALGAWARMVMARGAAVPAHLLALRDAPAEVTPSGDAAVARRLAMLRETEPRAFELAVVLNALPFTIPVARVVQEAHLGSRDSRPLAALLLSGLIEPMDEVEGAAGHWFAVNPEASALLRGSLRRNDARRVSEALVARVSEHIAAATGRSPDLTSFSPNDAGTFDLPVWAAPYARLALSLRGTSPRRVAAQGNVNDLREILSRSQLGRLMRDAAMDRALSSHDDPQLWDALLELGLTFITPAGERQLTPAAREALIEWHRDNPLWGIRILWVDDVPENNRSYVPSLLHAGAEVIEVETTREALKSPLDTFDIIISDMARREGGEEGLVLLDKLAPRKQAPPVIIFSSLYPRSRFRRMEAIHAGALAVTNDFEAIRDLIIEYARDPEEARHRGRRLAETAGRSDKDSNMRRQQTPQSADWGLVVNLDGDRARHSQAGCWIFSLALRNLFGIDPDRIDSKVLHDPGGLIELLDRQLNSASSSENAGYVYLCGGHDRPLKRDTIRQLERLLVRLSNRRDGSQIMLLADLASGPGDRFRFYPESLGQTLDRRYRSGPQILAIACTSRDGREQSRLYAHEWQPSSSSRSSIPSFTSQLIQVLESGLAHGRMSGRHFEESLETMFLGRERELWSNVSYDAEMVFERPPVLPLLRDWEDWRREAIKFAAHGNNKDALAAIGAARIVAPDNLDLDALAEMAIMEVALHRRLGADGEAATLLDETQDIWAKSKFAEDARFHQAVLAMNAGQTEAAYAIIGSGRMSQAVGLAIQRQEDLFEPLERFRGFRANVLRALNAGEWNEIMLTEFDFPLTREDATKTAHIRLNNMVEFYLRERGFGNEARIRLECEPAAFDSTDVEIQDRVRLTLRRMAEDLGVAPEDWKDADLDPTPGGQGSIPEHLDITLTVEQGPRRIIE